jgi:hypothetical protein
MSKSVLRAIADYSGLSLARSLGISRLQNVRTNQLNLDMQHTFRIRNSYGENSQRRYQNRSEP